MSDKIEKPINKKYYDHVSVGKRTRQIVHSVQEHDKAAMLEQIIQNNINKQIVVIAKSKRRVDDICLYLNSKNIKAASVHGNHRTEKYKETAIAFNTNETNVLITTDMILNLLELRNIEQIINYDVPIKPENYFNSLKYVDETGESVSLVNEADEASLSSIEYIMKLVIEEEEVTGFEPTPLPIVDDANQIVNQKKKKPRHSKQKAKKESKTKKK